MSPNQQQQLYTFQDAWTAWRSGAKFPIAFFGDSTFDGAATTGWVRNTLGADNVSPNAFSRKLEGLLREAAGQSVLRIYNAGFSGQTAAWGAAHIEQEFTGDSPYRDVKMIGIGFGINDRLGYPSEMEYRVGLRTHTIRMIEWCYEHGIQPFLLTTQAVVAPGVHTTYEGTYPMRTGGHIHTVAGEVKKELALEYGLPLIDLNAYTEAFLLYSSYSTASIIPDRLHFGDLGHAFVAELLFAHLVPYTIVADGYTKIDYSTQAVQDGVPEDWLTMSDSPVDGFKVLVDREREETADRKVMTVWLFAAARRPLALRAYKSGTTGSGAASSGEEQEGFTGTYVKVNGKAHLLTGPETELGRMEQGLYRLEVFTGTGTRVDFKGFWLD
ncbi:hypothetical protein J31TS4_26990 [Paenibacillus sp. J31TS4]|uniref:SGNH/GDSL hydrolase family protein n=1 Tax=Paenibacillus sp. J31TS4 TaxID=2807195 RepID=UPI001B1DCF51|nr:SGNH/GDSL hydrolase family protein [Paenibacillus sp. J31TS4]GIP39419.1 hypothetical protein J31TS4_26990 [Paenibacillus sp. J31TS4]